MLSCGSAIYTLLIEVTFPDVVAEQTTFHKGIDKVELQWYKPADQEVHHAVNKVV